MTQDLIDVLNAGSSSIKFAIYEPQAEPDEIARGQVENIGPNSRLCFADNGEDTATPIGATDHDGALRAIFDHIRESIGSNDVVGVGHRIAHGGVTFCEPQVLDHHVIEELRSLQPLAPLHQPHNLAAIDAARSVFPGAVQIGCFDTGFHRHHPWVNDTFALPRRYYDKGVRRYGFHGLSYDYITGALKTVAPGIALGRIVIAHLGNGASMCAVKDRQSVASTMGFSALDGLPMGTRCGQLDPGVVLYMLQEENLTPAQIANILYKESGLKGLSGMSNDMRELEACDAQPARDAIAYYVFRIRRELGAMCAVLGGIDGLVFCGGIGENSAPIRARICEGMDWLGIAVDSAANSANDHVISSGPVPVLVVPTDEERVVARTLSRHVITAAT